MDTGGRLICARLVSGWAEGWLERQDGWNAFLASPCMCSSETLCLGGDRWDVKLVALEGMRGQYVCFPLPLLKT